MDAQLKSAKRSIRQFMRLHYTDERLTMLLAHAKDGKLSFLSCCCFIGIVTARHPLQSTVPADDDYWHTRVARALSGAIDAEDAYRYLSDDGWDPAEGDEQRIRRLIPIIKAEMKRRERLRIESSNRDGAAALSQQVAVSVS